MTERVQRIYNILKSAEYKKNRSQEPVRYTLGDESCLMKCARIHKAVLDQEIPWFLPDERIGFNHSVDQLPYYSDFCPEGFLWMGGNITPDYGMMLQRGMDSVREEIVARMAAADEGQADFYSAALVSLDAGLDYARRSREAAAAAGLTDLADSLSRVPFGKPESYLDACVFMKFMLFTIHCMNTDHVTLGRFDRYMLPFYQMDVERGVSRETLLDITEEFFVSINLDADLYSRMQVGDNGQSMMLGGCDADGNDAFTDLSRLCMEASLDLNLIDPKINLRVSKNTPQDLLEFATLMTKQGMGFPQYCNDDIVIPGLIKLGYAPEDAADYTVAACWEFIIPGKGVDIPNIITMNFPAVVEKVMAEHLLSCDSFDALLEQTRLGIRQECDRLMATVSNRPLFNPAYLSLFVQPCLETGRDVSQGGAKYRNFGCHGAGISVAADALTAVNEVVYKSAFCSKEQLLQALKENFEGWGELRNRLLSCPKMGNNDDTADAIGMDLMETFSSYLNGKPNGTGGIFRAGTGSAMEYILSAARVGATADGRKAAEAYGSSYSPSLLCRLSGPLSCIQSFTKFDLTNIINGGPLTLEIHDSTFRNDDGIQKVAQLVKAFIMLGGHQLQLNAVNRDRLLDALEHPENHKNLIVRVWGWSGYFTELDRPYQEHIIRRTEFRV